jgi:hypothetical protein
MSCSIVFSQKPLNMCHLPVRFCTDPYGAAYSNVQIVIRISSLHSNMLACGTWRRWRLMVTVLHAMQFCKVDEPHSWIYVVNLMLMQWLLYSELWCYLLIQGIAHLHRSSTFSKDGALQISGKGLNKNEWYLRIWFKDSIGYRGYDYVLWSRVEQYFKSRTKPMIETYHILLK